MGLFLRRFFRHPLRVGGVAPSSQALARRAIAPVPADGAPIVVELRRRFPTVDVVVAPARELPAVLALHGLRVTDVVVSGLPWTLFPAPAMSCTLAAVTRSLAVGGAFTTFGYLHARRSAEPRRPCPVRMT
jgi:phospholipid N-methyltransferase